MKIIAHRGFWKTKKEQNTLAAFQRAVHYGFGIETDVRAHNGRLVIAHDCPGPGALSAEKAFKVFSKMDGGSVLALNIKCDGLHNLVQGYLKRYKIKNYFVFDASVPDTLLYAQKSIKYYARLSEYEPLSPLAKKASGWWLDAFHKDWFDARFLYRLLYSRKNICVVSPELHQRSHQKVWNLLRAPGLRKHRSRLMLCTDRPLQAEEYFRS